MRFFFHFVTYVRFVVEFNFLVVGGGGRGGGDNDDDITTIYISILNVIHVEYLLILCAT